MTYWPGTKTPKSANNAFDWKKKPSEISKHTDFVNVNRMQKHLMGKTETRIFPTFSKAQAARLRQG